MYYLISINIISFILMFIDKRKAVHNKYRIKESTLLFISLLGGCFGAFISMYLFGNGSNDALTLIKFGANNRYFVTELNQYYRLITSCFIHIGLLNLLFNCYALYVIGSQIENFYGKFKGKDITSFTN